MPGYSPDQKIYLWTNARLEFLNLFDWGNKKKTYFAFTTQEKAKTFLRKLGDFKMGYEFDRVLPITLREWFDGLIIKDKNFEKNLLALDLRADIVEHPDFNEGLAAENAGTHPGKLAYEIVTQET